MGQFRLWRRGFSDLRGEALPLVRRVVDVDPFRLPVQEFEHAVVLGVLVRALGVGDVAGLVPEVDHEDQALRVLVLPGQLGRVVAVGLAPLVRPPHQQALQRLSLAGLDPSSHDRPVHPLLLSLLRLWMMKRWRMASGQIDGPQRRTRYRLLKGFSMGTRVTDAKPPLVQSSRSLDSGSPIVPRPSPPWASDTVMQSRVLNPYSSEATGPTLLVWASEQLMSRQREMPPGRRASRMLWRTPSASTASWITSQGVT